METLIIVVHVLIALAIIGLILIQQGKGADMGASFGGGASQTLFGSRGTGNALTRATAIFTTLFFATSFALAVLAKNQSERAGDIGVPTSVEVPTDVPVPADVPRDVPVDVPADVPVDAAPKAVDGVPAVEQNAAPASDVPVK
jgi:preprotein translocase subunit SecG